MEVIAVMSIVAIVGSLVFVAVGSSRELARGTQCTNHFRQYGLAIQMFATRNGTLPDGQIPERLTSHLTGRLLPPRQPGPHRATLRVMGLRNEADSNDLPNLDATMDDFSDLIIEQLAPFMSCPSDSRPTGLSYRFCTGSVPSPFGVAIGRTGANPITGVGAFSRVHITNLSEVMDGLSQTIAMSERIIGNVSVPSSWLYRELDDHFLSPSSKSYRDFAAAQMSQTRRGKYVSCGLNARTGGTTVHTHYNHVDVPNSSSIDVGNSVYPDLNAVAARSYHPGQVFVLFLDGGVRAITDSVDIDSWQQMATMNGEFRE